MNEFYNFWYEFDSWREYSYLDEEEKEKGENREERRYLDKQNKAARQQRKKEEMARIRQLVDNAYQCDPRVARFKEEEKKRRQELKQAKQANIKAKKDEEERLRREQEEKELEAKRKAEEEEKQRKDEERRQKEAAKKKLRQENKQVEGLFKAANYFTEDPSARIEYMQELDKLCRMFSLEQLIDFRKALQALGSDAEKKALFLSHVSEMNKKLHSERIELVNAASSSGASSNSNNSANTKKVWSYADVQLLIKGVKLFPAGTANRWTVIANFVNDKSDSGVTRNHREVLEKAKELQNSGKFRLDFVFNFFNLLLTFVFFYYRRLSDTKGGGEQERLQAAGDANEQHCQTGEADSRQQGDGAEGKPERAIRRYVLEIAAYY